MNRDEIIKTWYMTPCEQVLCALVLKRNSPLPIPVITIEKVYYECLEWYRSSKYDSYFDDIDDIYVNSNQYSITGVECIYELLMFSEKELTIMFNLNRLFDKKDHSCTFFHNLSLSYTDVEDLFDCIFFKQELGNEVDLLELCDFAIELQRFDFENYVLEEQYLFKNHAFKHYIMNEIDWETFDLHFSLFELSCEDMSFTDFVLLEKEGYIFQD